MKSLTYLLIAGSAFAAFVPTPQTILQEVDEFLHPTRHVEIHHDYYDEQSGRHRKLCVLHPLGDGQFDDDNFQHAHRECGQGGIIRLPEANYTIGNPLTTHLKDAVLDVHGWISFSTDIDNWVAKRVPLGFQNLAIGWHIVGEDYVLDGHGTGGIFGNGQAWYNWAKNESNKYGRPMSFSITNSTNVSVLNWSVVQPQFWASIVVNSTNVLYHNYYVNATNFNPDGWNDTLSWIQNTDGADTYRSHNVTFDGMVFQGGDDCLAFKPNSSSITVRNVTCYGGTGIAFGSIGQYKGVADYIKDIWIEDVKLYPGQHIMQNGVYFKSWMGLELGKPPNGGGGGDGWSENITVKDVYMEKNRRPIALQSDLTYLYDHAHIGRNTGLFDWHGITFENITGTAERNRVVNLDCSKKTPCYDIVFKGLNVKPGKTDDASINFVCNNVIMDAQEGLQQCHPSNSTHESEPAGMPPPPESISDRLSNDSW